MTKTLLPLTAGLFIYAATQAQQPDHDTSYYRSYKGSIITRVFFSRNYNLLRLDPPGAPPDMKYHANTPLNLGLGFSYRFFSVSFSKGLDFLQSDAKKGKTRSFDLQTHIYRRKWTFDALTQFYKGYYLGQPDIGSREPGSYYLRPDMGLNIVGATAYRVLNDQRFSYGAGLAQNASQQRSAGSFLFGGQAFYTAIHADSALAPYQVDPVYNKNGIRKVHLFAIGPGIGYAYTFVYRQHAFLLGSVNADLNAVFSREIGNGIKADKVSLSPNYILRFGAGYNASRWSLSAVWFTSTLNASGESSGYAYTMRTGSYRLVYVRRIALNWKMRDILDN
jgi:hypothetical protein